MKMYDENNRKFSLAKVAIFFFAMVVVSAYMQASIKMFHDLDLPIIAGAAAGVAALVGAYAGANAWSKQAEARTEEAKATVEVAKLNDVDRAD
jgi:phosphatidylserine decarboxylase